MSERKCSVPFGRCKIDCKLIISEDAALIANEIAKVFSEKVTEIYNISNIYVMDTAKVSESPSNVNHARDVMIFTVIGIAIAIAYVVLLNVFDTTIKNQEDIEKNTGLIVLAQIPEIKVEGKKDK